MSNGYKIKKKLMDDTIAVPRKLISRLSEAGACELKLFMIMASLGDSECITEELLISELERAGASDCDLTEGLAFLRGAGLIEKCTAKAEPKPVIKEEKLEVKTEVHKPSSKPSYTSKELAAAANKGEFKALVEWASNRLGKTFNTSELSTLYSFCDYLCLPEDVVMLGIEHCVSEGKPSLRYAEKLLIDFADREINTYQKAEEYILKRKKYLSFEGKIRTMMGLGQRALTAKEKSFLADWQEWELSNELIELAYEKTVNKTSRATMAYMNSILKSWHDAGFKTVADVEKGDVKPSSADPSFDPDDYFRVAIEKSMKK